MLISDKEKCVNPVSSVNHICLDELVMLNKDIHIGCGTFGECALKLYKRFNLVVLEKQLPTSDLKAVINEAKCNTPKHSTIVRCSGSM